MNIKNILVPTDCSELSKEALYYAIKFANAFKASLTLLMVTPSEPLTIFNTYGYFSPELHQQLQGESKRRAVTDLKMFWNSIPDPGIEAKLVNVTGDPFIEILHFAAENDTNMIIMGTHGHTGLTHILMGSVAEKVVRYSPYPVLTIKREGYTFE